MGKDSQTQRMGKPGNLVPKNILQNPSNRENLENWWLYFSYSMGDFSHYIPILWYTSSNGKCMGVLISFPKYGKKQENPSNWKSLENYFSRKSYKNPSYVEKLGTWYSQFSHSSHSMVYFIICKMRGFLHQFPMAWENTAKSIKLKEPGKLVPIFSPKYGYFSSIRFPSYGIIYHMVNP